MQMGIDDRMTREIVRRVLTVAKPDRIILFGSAARAEMTRDSDIDLLILDPTSEDTRKKSVLIGDALRGLGFPFDVIVMRTARFEETKEVIGGIAHPASRHGRVIYEAP